MNIKPDQQFENAANAAVDTAMSNRVHPAIVYTVLGSLQKRVLEFMENSARMGAQAEAMTREIMEQAKQKNGTPPNVEPLPKS